MTMRSILIYIYTMQRVTYLSEKSTVPKIHDQNLCTEIPYYRCCVNVLT